MFRHTMWVMAVGLLLSGCASDGNMQSSDGSSPAAGAGAPPASPRMSDGGTGAPSGTMSQGGAAASAPSMSGSASRESQSMKPSSASNTRIAAGVEEETLDTCLGRIPKDATVGQKMLAEQTCRRDFGSRR